MSELTTKQKEMLFRFHIKDVTMSEVADELDISPNRAHKVYTDNIVGVIKEFKDNNHYQLKFGGSDGKEPKPEPESQPEPDLLDAQPKVVIKKDAVMKLMGDDLPVVIEDGDFAKEVALFLTDGDEDAVANVEKDGELPPIGIAKKGLLKDVEEGYILVRPVFNDEKNTIDITHEKISEPDE